MLGDDGARRRACKSVGSSRIHVSCRTYRAPGVVNTVTNTGTIHGAVTLSANDLLNAGGGTITGPIWASSGGGVEFAYSGDWGHETIHGFLGGKGSTHDLIQFNADEFSSYKAVQSAMTQEGSDVLIKLGAADTIVLARVKLSNLVGADFKLV